MHGDRDRLWQLGSGYDRSNGHADAWGQYCDLYLGNVESALKKIAGVKAVDLKSMKGHAIVTLEGDKSTPKQLAEAVNGVKGDGWHCSAQVMK
ncbi:MAG TPA: heavy-metal-associated domain-containing protein [Nitrospira sp.]|nr:heavy-metal-associated domain-containing protein [Nitrospira sp.]